MEPVDTLICARWVLPVEPDGPALARPCRRDQGRPHRRGAADRRRRARDSTPPRSLERPHHVLLPGLVNAHTHAAMTLLRGRAENLSLGPWLTDAIWPIERRWIDPEYVRDGTELAIAEMLRGGITCFADMHLWPEVVARTAAELHMRASVGLVVVEAETRWASGPDDYIEKGMALRDEYRGDPLDQHVLRAARAVHRRRCHAAARSVASPTNSKFRSAMHLHESHWEIEQSRRAVTALRPLARLAKLGLASPLLRRRAHDARRRRAISTCSRPPARPSCIARNRT